MAYGRKKVSPTSPSVTLSRPPQRSCGSPKPQRHKGAEAGHAQSPRASATLRWAKDGQAGRQMHRSNGQPVDDGCRQVGTLPKKLTVSGNPWKKRPIPKGKIHLPINLPGVMFVSGKVTETTYHSPFWRLTKVYEVSSRRLRSMMDDHLYPGNPFYPSS